VEGDSLWRGPDVLSVPTSLTMGVKIIYIKIAGMGGNCVDGVLPCR
jgi:hypothetical protein